MVGINKQIYFIDDMNLYEDYPVVLKINKQGS